MKTIAYIAAGILIFFGVLFIWAAFGSVPRPEWIAIGLVSVAIGFGLIFFAGRIGRSAAVSQPTEVTYKVDLSGDVKMETLKCQSCGGTLSSENVKMVAGAPVVTCPFCGSSYQLTEEPKW